MLQKLLLLLLLLIGIGVLVFRLSDAGGEIARRKSFFENPFTILFEQTLSDSASSTSADKIDKILFPFPATPETPLDDGFGEGSGDLSVSAFENASTREKLIAIEEEYDTLDRRIKEARTFGNPSPYRGLVRIDESYGGVSANDPTLEYVILATDARNSAPISLAGWSLQSVKSNTRIYLPQGARALVAHQVPTLADVYLNPGERAIVTSGMSPVGVSFRENMCTGYLSQFQTFIPSLEERCPTAESEVLSEPDTTRTNDPRCVAFAEHIPRCRFYVGEPPQNVTAQCYSFVRNMLTYAGCAIRHGWRPSYGSDTWRLFLGEQHELWDGEHDIVRLFDREGRTVDVWTY